MSEDDLNARLKNAAQKFVGQAALISKYGLDLFALVDKLLRGLGAATAADGRPVTSSSSAITRRRRHRERSERQVVRGVRPHAHPPASHRNRD